MLRLLPFYSVSIGWGTLKNLETCVILTGDVLCQEMNSELIISLFRNAENWSKILEIHITVVL